MRVSQANEPDAQQLVLKWLEVKWPQRDLLADLRPWSVASDSQLRALLKRSGLIAADALVVDKFCLPGNTVRADLVAAGEELVGYEINAGADRLTRLRRSPCLVSLSSTGALSARILDWHCARRFKPRFFLASAWD
ncbi:hypothetical protein [uncultured Variovorax sp.]|uniref:hypothetical protein n=1 Tax=uncultured Variovorax sp. TaxID=114708 RepID=UPI0025DA4113|nr:hypothetical protein [uncultured Variovorax sp.]